MKLDENFLLTVDKYCTDKNLDKSYTRELIDNSLIKIFRKANDLLSYQGSDITVAYKSEGVYFIIPKTVVLENPKSILEVSLEDAKKLDFECVENQKITFEEKLNFSRVLLDSAKKLIFQQLRDYEKNLLFQEYKKKENELTHCYFQRKKGENYIIELGKLEALMPKREQIAMEKYRSGDRLKALIKKVEFRPREKYPTVILSRSSSKFIEKLFQMEVPEIYDGMIDVVNVVRQPTIRTKILVRANREDIDPVGACVGLKGVRIQSIVRELGKERIDIVPYSSDPVELLKASIAPAIPKDIKVNVSSKEALIIVAEDMLSIAIGLNGSNVRLASILCDYKIDVRTEAQYQENSKFHNAKEELDKLFKDDDATNSQPENEEYTPLSELGIPNRIIDILESEGIYSLEILIDKSEEDLAKIKGIGKTTASKIINLLLDSVEID